jgi:hypothetical protein
MLGLGLGLWSGGQPSGGAPAFDPATLDRSDWNGTASAGDSGSRSFSAGAIPDVGTTVDGFDPAVFNGTNDYLTDVTNQAEAYITTTAYTVNFVIKPTNQPADPGAVYNCKGILTESGGNWGIVRRVNEVVVYHQSTEVAAATVPEDVWSHVVVRFGLVAGELDIFVDGALADHNTGVAATGSVTAAGLRLGTNFGQAQFFEGEVMECAIQDSAASDVEVAGDYAYAQARYPSMGL